ncbi:sterol 26-hydroxylase, mitochondrial-like [Antedon mediterranea]|uniref:sterol 26-hydroxylase, mitochondrial-like n=1 Tax=Antedon mediterranea TaxID=105859 RepID=UPI003AF7FA21
MPALARVSKVISTILCKYRPATLPISRRYTESATSNPPSKHLNENLKSLDDVPIVGIQGAPLMINKLLSTWLTLRSDLLKNHELTGEYATKYGKMYRNSLLTFDMIVLSDPKLIQDFFRQEKMYPVRMPFPYWLEHRRTNNEPLGIILQSGEQWHRSRSAMSRRLLQPQEISLFLNSMHGVSTDVFERLKSLRPKEGPNKDIVPNLEEELFRWAFEYNKLKELAEKAANNSNEQVDDDSYLAYLVAQNKLSEEEIYGNMTELLSAAVDTTSITTLWTLYCLAKNPDCQERLYEEVTRVLPEGITPTKEHYNQMSYLKAVMQETQRLYPIQPLLSRNVTEDMNLNGYIIPAGMTILLNMYSVSRDPEYFEDPLIFKPERWLNRVKGESLNHFLMLPFGFGVRSCIGRRMAEQKMHTLLPMYAYVCIYLIGEEFKQVCLKEVGLPKQIIRNFQVVIDKEVDAVSQIILAPDQALDLRLVDRH